MFTNLPFEIIVIDNASRDGTYNLLRNYKNIKVIRNSINTGFSKSINQGIMASQGNYILLLNNDTVLGPNWLVNLMSCIKHRADIGMVGPKSNYVSGMQLQPFNYNGSIEGIIAFMKNFNIPDPKKWFEVFNLSGFCLLIKREVINSVGLLDERFKYGGYEDEDYCRRVMNSGYKLYCAGDTFVYHYGSRTLATNRNFLKHYMENQKKFFIKWNINNG